MPNLPKGLSTPYPVYLGIDPGASGGYARILPCSAWATAMPDTETDIWEGLAKWTIEAEGLEECSPFAVIEKVHAMPGNGVSSMFKFGMSYGGLRMALVAAGIPFEEVQPRAWQKALGIPKRERDESPTEWKNRLKAKAQQLFPSVKVTLATADALLIAEYCRRSREGKL